MEKNSQPVFVPLTNDLPALLSTSAVVSPLEAPPLHLLSHQRLAQGRGKFPRAGSSSLESTPLPLLWGSHSCQVQLPVWWRGAGSGAALSRRLSRKSREGPPGADLPRLETGSAGAPEPSLAALQLHRWRESLLLPEWRGAAGVTPVVTQLATVQRAPQTFK